MSNYVSVDYKPKEDGTSSNTKCHLCDCAVGSKIYYLDRWYCRGCYNYVIREGAVNNLQVLVSEMKAAAEQWSKKQ